MCMTVPFGLQEFLAFTSKPVTLEDITSVQGKALSLESRPATRSTSNRQSYPLRDRAQAPPTFLTSSAVPPPHPGSAQHHPNIHHFCTEPSCPQLPATLQGLSRRTHTVSVSEASQFMVGVVMVGVVVVGVL